MVDHALGPLFQFLSRCCPHRKNKNKNKSDITNQHKMKLPDRGRIDSPSLPPHTKVKKKKKK
jgi:hypothetical protein